MCTKEFCERISLEGIWVYINQEDIGLALFLRAYEQRRGRRPLKQNEKNEANI